MPKEYCGYISIIGKPNVGKSTILNAILEKKVSITSRKSQTTRNNVEDASFRNSNEVKSVRQPNRANTIDQSSSKNQSGRYKVSTNKKKPRDNSSRFDD